MTYDIYYFLITPGFLWSHNKKSHFIKWLHNNKNIPVYVSTVIYGGVPITLKVQQVTVYVRSLLQISDSFLHVLSGYSRFGVRSEGAAEAATETL